MELVEPPATRQELRWSLRAMWGLASILNFFHVFWSLLNIHVEFSAEEFETALMTPNDTLGDIHVPLLKSIPPITRMALTRDTWITVLARKLRDWWHWVAEGDIPLVPVQGTEIGVYKNLDTGVRVVILKALCDIRVEQEDIGSHIENSIKNGVRLSSFRKERVGGDSNRVYYCSFLSYPQAPMGPHPISKDGRNLATPEPEPTPTTTTSDLALTLKKKHHLQQQQQKHKHKQPSFEHPDPQNTEGPSFFIHSKLDAHSKAKSLNGSAEFDPEKLSYLEKQQQRQQKQKHSKKGCAQEAEKVGGKDGVDIEVKLRRKFKEWEDLGKKLKEKEKVGALVVRKEGLRKSCDGEVESGGVRRKKTAASSIVKGGVGGRRWSIGGVQVELSHVVMSNGARVVSVDMPPFMQIHAVDCARKTSDSMEKFSSKTLALALKKEFDRVYGPAWHCIVGTSFGSFVTHSVGGFVYFAMDQKMYILLFKTTVQRAD